MVQKWAIGAMINVSGSIAINLGTNLMKLSHKMEKGELPPGTFGASVNPSKVAPGDIGPPAASNGTITHPRSAMPDTPLHQSRFLPSKGSKGTNKVHVELTTYSAIAPTASEMGSGSDPEAGNGRKAGGGNGGGSGKGKVGLDEGYEEEAVRLSEESATDSPSSAAGVSVCSDDRAGLLGKSGRRSNPRGNGRNGNAKHGVSNENGDVKGGAPREDFGDFRGVRRRALSSPRHELLGRANGEGGMREAGVEVEFECKTKALWYLGAVMLVAGSLVNFASFGFAPQSLLASLGSVQFISNVVFGKVILHEIVTRRIIVGTATIIVGNTFTLCFSPHQDENYSTGQLKAFYDLEYNILLMLELTVALLMHAIYKGYQKSKEQGTSRLYSDLAMPLAYAICSAIIGTQSVIQAKCMSELLTLTFQGDNQLGSPFTYVVIAVWLSTTVFWLVRMNRALAMFHGLFIIPALQVFWTFFSVIGGGFYFEEFKSLRPLGGLGFAFGVMVVFLGVYQLAPRTQASHGRRTVAGKGDAGEVSEEEDSDLRRMLRMEDHSPVASQGPSRTTPRVRSAGEESLEAGDEEIDWDHTRMLSLAFFPSISTDQDVGYLTKTFEAAEPETAQQPDAMAGSTHSDAEGALMAGEVRERSLTRLPRPKDTHSRAASPIGSAAKSVSRGSSISDASDVTLEGDNEGRSRGSQEDKERRRNRRGSIASRRGGGKGKGTTPPPAR